MEKYLKKEFVRLFGAEGEISLYFAPGRVNLIGEHIDYNGGVVFPCALDLGTYAALRLRNDKTIGFASLNFDKRVNISLDNILFHKDDDWTNYPKGVISEFLRNKEISRGFDILFYGNIPNGSGLSSSASIEVLTAFILNDLFDFKISGKDMALISQKAENNFVGVNCGIMDQFAVAMGKRDNGILLNCNTLEYNYVPLHLTGVKIVISNTKKRRGLADSKYNQRRRECDSALASLRKKLDIDYLCDLDSITFEANKYLIDDPVVLKRATHVVYENIRTKESASALENNDLLLFGNLMIQSHDSLRDLYEVTGVELDTMVDEALKIHGTLGSRMTGAGFGGCTVSLVKDNAVDDFIRDVGFNYEKRTGIKPEFYIANPGGGPEKL